MAFPEALLPKDIDLYLKTKKLLTFLGSRIYVSSKGNKSYRFFLHGIIPGSSMSDLVATRTSDKYAPGFAVTLSNGKKIGIPVDHPYLLVEKMGYREGSNQDGKDLFNHIKKSLMDNLKILGANFDASHLETGIEFVILQALSQGKSGGFSNKLHGLIIGPPNTGKSLLTDAAKVINPIVGEISVVGPKITAAGLIGKVKSEGDVSVSTGGSIPAASGGTFIIQDFHSLSGDKRATIHEIFSLLMEKGVVRDDTSANATLDAEVSLLIDTNRYHQVLRTNPPEPNTYRDLDIPINILSRYDFILDIPKDAIRQEHIADNIGLLASAPISTKWQDELKTLIAFLRDVYGGIIVPDDVEKYAKSELQKLFKKFRSSNFETNIQDHQPRIARSQRKYVLAIARAWARPVISTDHVDFAMKFIQEKVSFLASQSYDELNKDGRTIRKATRAEWILQQFADGRNFRLDDLKALYDREYPSIDPRTIKRDIQLLMASKKITRVRHGVYAPARSGDQVPSPEKHVNRKKKAKNQKISKRRARKMVRRKKS
jgi:DNA replicative helicase MCM subunit Mcm2 (Cdc46/Mcm family)